MRPAGDPSADLPELEEASSSAPEKKKRKEKEPKPSKKKPNRATGRFDLTVMLPGVQAVADTSPWELFGVPLQIVAAQDPGARKERLWESFAVETREDSELVIKVLKEVAEGKPGLQVVTDQGTPYMSEATQEALEEFECDHAPQKEGTPTEKATKERAFRTVKDALRPLANLSKKVIEHLPALRRADFARASGRILLSVFLRVYEAAPRVGGHPLSGRGRDELQAISAEQRENARAEGRSKRLLLTEIHRAYDFPQSEQKFIRVHRNHAIEDIQEAERRLRRYACRCRVGACDRYFAAILRNVRDENQRRRRRERAVKKRHAKERRELRSKTEAEKRRQATLRDHPEIILDEGLDMVSYQWSESKGALLADGGGLGERRIRESLESMYSGNTCTLRDRAEIVWQDWVKKEEKDSAQVEAVRSVFERTLKSLLKKIASWREILDNQFEIRPRRKDRPPIRGPTCGI